MTWTYRDITFDTAAGLKALLYSEEQLARVCPTDGEHTARPSLEPHLSMVVAWSDDAICWAGHRNTAMQIETNGHAIGAIRPGLHHYNMSLPAGTSPSWDVHDEAARLAIRTTAHLVDRSGIVLPTTQPIPTKCFFAPQGGSVHFDAGAVEQVRQALRVHAKAHATALGDGLQEVARLVELRLRDAESAPEDADARAFLELLMPTPREDDHAHLDYDIADLLTGGGFAMLLGAPWLQAWSLFERVRAAAEGVEAHYAVFKAQQNQAWALELAQDPAFQPRAYRFRDDLFTDNLWMSAKATELL